MASQTASVVGRSTGTEESSNMNVIGNTTLGTDSTNTLTVNAVSTFVGNAGFTGNITSINGVTTSWPSTQSGVNQVLLNNGSGVLSWLAQASVGAAWSALSAPTANLTLSMGNQTTTFTWSTATGALTNLFNFIDTANNTGTGYLVNIDTASGSTAKPFRLGFTGGGAAGTNDKLTLNASGVLTITAPTLSGTVIGTYTIGGTPTLGATLALGGQTLSGTASFSGAITFSAASTAVAVTNNITVGTINSLAVTTSAGTLTVANNASASLITSGNFALTLTSTATTNATIPSGTVTLVDLASSQALTNKTISGLTVTTSAGTLTIANSASASLITSGNFALTLTSTATTNATIPSGTITLVDLASSQALTTKTYNGLTVSTTAGTLTIANNASASLVTSGNFALTLTSTATTNSTFPSGTDTLMGLGTIQTVTAAKTFNTSTLKFSNSQVLTVAVTSQTTGAATLTIPDFASVSDTFVFITLAQTLSNKTFVAPALGAATATTLNSLAITTSAGTLTIANNASASLITSGNFALTLTSTATTNSTFPSGTDTLMGLGTIQTVTAAKTFNTSTLKFSNSQVLTVVVTAQTTGAANLTIPDFANVSDTFAFVTLAQTLSNKTFVAPALGTPASGVLTNCSGTAASLTAGNVTTNANLTGPITSVGNATSIAAQTGTGTTFVTQASPTLTTPNIGAATATTLNSLTITTSAGTLTIANNASASLITSGNFALTLTSTATTNATFPSGTVTLAGLGTVQTWTAVQSYTSTNIVPTTDNTSNIGTASLRFALIRGVVVTSGDMILSDKLTGEEYWKIHEDKNNIYFDDIRDGKGLMRLDRDGNLYVRGEIRRWV